MSIHELRRRTPQTEYTIALDDLSFEWTTEELEKAIKLYNSGRSIRAMAEKLRPYTPLRNSLDEVAILIMHLARQDKIKPREGTV